MTEVRDGSRFVAGGVPRRCDDIRPFAGWKVVWLSGNRSGEESRIRSYDPAAREMCLADDGPLAAGDRFALYPAAANWQIHHNIITSCGRALDFPADLPAAVIADNLTD